MHPSRLPCRLILATLRVLSALCCVPASSAMLSAQGHDHPHEAGLGTVRFPTSCRPDVASAMNRGVALLHSFEFGEAIHSFDDVLAADSTCALAAWGRALALWSNPMNAANRAPEPLERGRQAAAVATRLAARATPRERGYAAAVASLYGDYERVPQRQRVVAYEHAMATLVAAEPADTEARIFHAIALVAAAPTGDTTYADLRRAGATLESLWAAQPDHPGLAHYIIHAYDAPRLASQAASAARRYAEIAPAAPHALHMPSHTFTRLGMWDASIEANRRSADAAIRTNEIAEALHADDYLVHAYLQLGRYAEARDVLDGLPALAARFDPSAISGAAPGAAGTFALAAMPARYALERGAWAEAASLAPMPSAVPFADAMTWFARALGAARLRRVAAARQSVDSLAAYEARLDERGDTYWAEQVRIQRLGAEAWLELARSRRAEALALMQEAAEREERSEKSPFSPGPLAPARELLGDMLLQLGRRSEARAAYGRTLEREPGRRRAQEGLARTAGH